MGRFQTPRIGTPPGGSGGSGIAGRRPRKDAPLSSMERALRTLRTSPTSTSSPQTTADPQTPRPTLPSREGVGGGGGAAMRKPAFPFGGGGGGGGVAGGRRKPRSAVARDRARTRVGGAGVGVGGRGGGGVGEEESVRVAIRVRPLANKGGHARAWHADPIGNAIVEVASPSGGDRRRGAPPRTPRTPRGRGDASQYAYDRVFGEDANTCEIHGELVRDIAESVARDGVNGAVFTYGQTSSGKTFTMQGPDTGGSGSSVGLVQLAAEDIFASLREERCDGSSDATETSVRVSYVEIYNEELRDLLGDHGGGGGGGRSSPRASSSLVIREDQRGAISVEGLREVEVHSLASLMSVFRSGEANKSVGSTRMNDRSSRSHAILKITVDRTTALDPYGEDKENADCASGAAASRGLVTRTSSSLSLVDLAGSESVRHTGASGMQKKEGGMINQSLLTLSKVLMSLGQKNPGHINYRDSKLTRILKPSLSGNARMAVICCISPSDRYIEETRSTLQFASRAKLVTTCATSNEVVDDDSDLVARLRLEGAKAQREVRRLEERVREMEEASSAGADATRRELDNLKRFVFSERAEGAASRTKVEAGSLSVGPGVSVVERGGLTSTGEAVFSPSGPAATSKDDLHLLPDRGTTRDPTPKALDEDNIFRAALEFKAEQVRKLQARLGSKSPNGSKAAKDRRRSPMRELRSPDVRRRVSGIDEMRSPKGTPDVLSRSPAAERRYSMIREQRSPAVDRRASGIDEARTPDVDGAAGKRPNVGRAMNKLKSVCHDTVHYRTENGQLASRLAEAEEAVAGLERQVEELTSQKNDALDWIEELYVKSDEKDEKIMQACEARNDATKRCEALESELANTKEALQNVSMMDQQSISQSDQLRLEIKESRAKMKAMETEIDSHTDKVEQLYLELATAKNKFETAQDTIRQLKTDQHEADMKLRELEVERLQLKSERDELSNGASGRYTSDLDKENEELKRQVQELEGFISEYGKEKRALIEQIERYEEDLTRVDSLLKSKADELDDAMFSIDKMKREANRPQGQSFDEVEALKSEREALELTLNAKVKELQQDLDSALDGNESLMKKLETVAKDLEAKLEQLESLNREKNEAMKKLKSTQEKCNTDLELSKVHETTLRAEILKREEALGSLRDENESLLSSLETKAIQMNGLEQHRNEALDQLRQSQEKYHMEIKRGEEMAESLRAEKRRQLADTKENEASRVNHELRGLKAENERLKGERLRLTTDFDNYYQKVDGLSSELTRVKVQLKCSEEKSDKAEQRLAKSEEEKSELSNHLNAADARIKDLFARVQNAKKELNALQSANASLKGRDKELRTSISRIQRLVEALSSENAELKEKNNRDRRGRESLESRYRELLSTVTNERDNLIESNADLSSKSEMLSDERDAALREKEITRLKLDKITASFEADYETARAKIDTLLAEKKELQGKITFLEAGKASVETNADRILERDNALVGQHERLKSSFKKNAMKVAELQDEVDLLVKRLAHLKEENGRLYHDNCALREVCAQAPEVRLLDDGKNRSIFGFKK